MRFPCSLPITVPTDFWGRGTVFLPGIPENMKTGFKGCVLCQAALNSADLTAHSPFAHTCPFGV